MSTDPRRRLDAWLQSVDDLLAQPSDVPVLLRPAEAEAEPAPELIGKLWVRLHKERDLELHVRVGWLAGTEFVQLVDVVPSTGGYETSVMIERALLDRLLGELAALASYGATTAHRLSR